MAWKLRWIGIVGIALVLSACFDLDDDERQQNVARFNRAPTITGIPSLNVLEGQLYEFKPAAADPDGSELAFSISRKPVWARFDRKSGRLWGTPGPGDVGNFTNIVISVSDGEMTSWLTDFDISVNPVANGQATLSWNPPTENSDGSTLTNLGGYRIYYGRNPDNLTQVVVIDNPGLTRYVVENLTPAVWHFAMTSVSAAGVESARTVPASKPIG